MEGSPDFNGGRVGGGGGGVEGTVSFEVHADHESCVEEEAVAIGVHAGVQTPRIDFRVNEVERVRMGVGPEDDVAHKLVVGLPLSEINELVF